MDTKLLMKCDNPVYADEVIGKLAEAGIAASQHDDGMDPSLGSLQGQLGIGIRVFEKDYDRAREVVDQIVKGRVTSATWCPLCGSDDIEKLPKRRRHISASRIAIALLLVLIGAAWLLLNTRQHVIENAKALTVLHMVAVGLVTIGMLHIILPAEWNNYHCRHCNRDFYHMD